MFVRPSTEASWLRPLYLAVTGLLVLPLAWLGSGYMFTSVNRGFWGTSPRSYVKVYSACVAFIYGGILHAFHSFFKRSGLPDPEVHSRLSEL